MFDVVAVSLETNRTRFIAQNETEKNAEAIEKMAVIRRGLDTEFFAVVSAGSYKDGDVWAGTR